MFNDDDLCPCASGLFVRSCACKARKFVPLPASTKTPEPRTGLVLSRCYASALEDCSPKISGEHPVSEIAIRETVTGNSVRVTGGRFESYGPEGKVISVGSLTKNVLCDRHNSALSGVDVVGGMFTRAHLGLMEHLHKQQPADYHRLFNGYDIERWLLKILCAKQHGECIPGVDEIQSWTVPRRWLEILFGGAPFPPDTGLYAPKIRDPETWRSPGIRTIRTYFTSQRMAAGIPIIGQKWKRVSGIQLSIFGVTWELLMERPPNPQDFVYRPRMLRFPDPKSQRGAFLHFGWDGHPPTFAGKCAFPEEKGFCEAMAAEAVRIRENRTSS
jgi:hypothetical protein